MTSQKNAGGAENSDSIAKCLHNDVCHVVHTYGECGKKCDYDTRKGNKIYPLTDADIAELIDYADAEDAGACIRSICERIKARGRS